MASGSERHLFLLFFPAVVKISNNMGYVTELEIQL